jgi:signal transduction histidine kinase
MPSEVPMSGTGHDRELAVEELKRELAKAHRREAVTAEVLKVISRSKFDLQAVLDTLVQSAVTLCEADFGHVRQREGDRYPVVASFGLTPDQHALFASQPTALTRGSVPGRALLERRIVHFPDVLTDPEFARQDLAKAAGFRAAIGVPLISGGQIVGLLTLNRRTAGAFSDNKIALIETFADQAVIAIENTRLFEEVQARTKAFQEALEYQTATSEVLGVISRSPTNVQPVFETIAKSAAQLCKAQFCHVFRFDGQLIHFAASHGQTRESIETMRRVYPIPPGRVGAAARSILTRTVEAIPDILADPEYHIATVPRYTANYRSIVAVPMLKDGGPVGAICLARSERGHFPDRQIDLLRTFADQAVIAIENTRLFEAEQASKRELQESLEYQTAISEVLGVISRSPSEVQPVLDTIAKTARRLCEADRVVILRLEKDRFLPVARDGITPGPFDILTDERPPAADHTSVAGRAVLEKRAIHVTDVRAEQELIHLKGALGDPRRTMLGVPLFRDGAAVGAIVLSRTVVKPFAEQQVALLTTFADQAVIAIENTRLFEEVQARTRELAKTVEDLEIASQHKSQFVANMSHELRTPLAAILGYAELIQEGFYGPLSNKALESLTRIRSNGKHLLGLINTVLDIAKIESGQFTLNMTEYAIESVVETVRAATESLAQNKKLTLTTSVEKSLPVGLGDEQRLTQVLLNLVGNAIKFTDAGEVTIAAGARNGRFAVSVTDTGPGIPLDQQGRIFEQFHQVDSSLTKAKGGTGLGLAIAKQIVEMHGGRIWVESTLGKGSTFQMEIPTRADFRNRAP